MKTHTTILVYLTACFLFAFGCEKSESPSESASNSGNAKAFLARLKNQGWSETEPPRVKCVQNYERADSVTSYLFQRSYKTGVVSHTSSLGLDVAGGTVVKMQLTRGMMANDVTTLLEGFKVGLSEDWEHIPQEAESIEVYSQLLTQPYEFDDVTVAVLWNYGRNPMGFIICTKDYFEWQMRQMKRL